jgi:hypothetical protein
MPSSSIWCATGCGRPLSAWDLERRETICIRCYLISQGAIKPSATSDGR